MADYTTQFATGTAFETAFNNKVNKSDIQDNLNGTSGTKPLSDKQGKILNDKLVNIANPNLLINGNFQVWQRGTSFTVGTSAFVYTADRWRVKATSSVVTITKVATGLQTSGSCVLEYVQSDADAIITSGKTVTISYCINGTLQPPATYVISSKLVLHIELPANAILNWVKAELCTIATPRVIRPFAEELRNCQAYYEKSYDYDAYAGANTNNGRIMISKNPTDAACYGTIHFKATKTKTPLITMYDASGNILTGGFTAYQNTIDINKISTSSLLIVHYVADAEDYT